MPLTLDVFRLLTWKALLGQTWALDRVFDSPSSPADIRVVEEREPFISVYVDDGDWGDSAAGYDSENKSIREMGGTVTLIIEVTVASPRSAQEVDNDEVPGMGGVSRINATDPALEMQMGLINRQVEEVLLSTNPANPWAEIWRRWINRVENVAVRRGGPGDTGQQPKPRFASRVYALKIDIIGEPVRGDSLDDPRWALWKAFIEAAEGDADLSGTAALIRAHIERPGGLPSWRIAQKELMTSKSAMQAIGEAPQEGFDEPPPGMEQPAGLDRITGDGGLDTGGLDTDVADENP